MSAMGGKRTLKAANTSLPNVARVVRSSHDKGACGVAITSVFFVPPERRCLSPRRPKI